MTVDTSGRSAARALLQASERLGPPPDLARLRRHRRRRAAGRAGLAFAAVVVAAVLVGQVLGLEWLASGPAVPPAATAPPGVPDLDHHPIDVGRADASEVAAGTDGVWVLNHHSDRPDELVRVDPGRDRVVARVPLGASASAPAVGEDGSLFAVRPRDGNRHDRPELLRVDPVTNRVAATIALPSASRPYGITGLVAARGAVWVAYPGRGLVRVDPASGATRELKAGGRLVAVDHLAFAGGWLWAAKGAQLGRVDPGDGTVTATVSDPDPRGALTVRALAGGVGGLWLHGFGQAGERLLRLDPVSGRMEAASTLSRRTDRREARIGTGDRLVAVRSGSSLFLVAPADGTVRAIERVPGSRGAGMAVGGEIVWISEPAKGRLRPFGPVLLDRP